MMKILISLVLSILFIGCANDTSTYQTEIKQPIKKQIKSKLVKHYSLNIKPKLKNKNLRIEYVKSIKKEFNKRLMLKRNLYNNSISESYYSNKKMKWQSGRKYCENLYLYGHDDWRLPIINEIYFLKINSLKKYWTLSILNENNQAWLVENNKFKLASKNTKGLIICVRDQYLVFDNYTNLRVYATAKFSMGKNIDNIIFEVKNKKGNLDKLLYTRYPFKEISRLTNKTLSLWLEPRKIDKDYFLSKVKKPILISKIKKPNLPSKIKKPSLPPVPKLVKSQFETKKMFEKRVNEAIVKRHEIIKQIQAEYRQKVEKRNQKIIDLEKEYNKKLLELEKINNEKIEAYNNQIKEVEKQYNDEIALIKKEQEYKKSILPQKIKEFQKGAFKVVMGTFYFTNPKYDAETQTMYVNLKSSRSSYQKRVALSVPLNIAKNFYDNIKNIKADVKFDFDKNKITLNSINAIYDDKTYMAKLTDKDYKPEKIEVVLADKKIDFKADKNAKLNLKNVHLETIKPIKLTLQNPNLKDYYQVGGIIYQDGKKVSGKKYNDDIPILLAKTKQTPISNKKWLFVIGIEKYDNTDNIAYASRTAKLFTKVMQKKLGISKRHTYFLLDDKATTARILNNLKLMLREVKPGDTIYFYYNGHGIPAVTKNNEPFLLPSDQIPDFVVENKDLMLKQIYTKLSNSKASKVVVFVDSCFSGATDGKSVIKGVAATRLVPKQVRFNHKKMVVLTAGRDKEYSNAYPQKGERLFSYYVMKSILKDRKDIKSLYSEVYIKVKDTSNSFGPLKVQEPTISGNKDMKL